MSKWDLLELVEKDPAFIDPEYGVEKYKWLNGNMVSQIQRHAMFEIAANLIRSIFNEPIKSLVIGGPPGEFPGDVPLAVNVVIPHEEKERAKHIVNYNGVGIDLPDESMHVVESCHSLEHLKDVHGSVSEAYRILKKGGYFILIVPDVNYHKHDLSDLKPGNRCYHEWTAYTCIDEVFKSYLDEGKFSLVQFNTRHNVLDFDLVFKKLK
jgi:SAM-dependent methyltransferase